MLTAANFNVVRATPNGLLKLNEALAYLQKSPKATAVLQKMVDQRIAIYVIEPGEVYPASADAAHRGRLIPDSTWPVPGKPNQIDWDPTYQVRVDGGGVGTPGLLSPAFSLLHEGLHATDPVEWTNPLYRIKDPVWTDGSEYAAIQQEYGPANELSEYNRHTHVGETGDSISDVTDHVIYTRDALGLATDEVHYTSNFDFTAMKVARDVADEHNSLASAEIIKETVYGLGVVNETVSKFKPSPTQQAPAPYGKADLKLLDPSQVFSVFGSTRTGNLTWSDGSGTVYTLQHDPEQLYSGPELIISGGAIKFKPIVGSQPLPGTITVTDFDVFMAETRLKGFLGVKLQGSIKIKEGIGLSFTLSLDGPSSTVQHFHVKLSHASWSDFKISAGGQIYSINPDGSFDVTLAAGTTTATFKLVDMTSHDGKSDIAKGSKLTLAATLSDEANPGGRVLASDATDFVYDPANSNPGHVPKNVHAVLGTNGNYYGDGGNDQVVAAWADNHIDLTRSSNDVIDGGSGHNIVSGGSGNVIMTLIGMTDDVGLGSGRTTVNASATGHDTIKSVTGDAIVNGRGGSHVVLIGSGTNEVYADSQTSFADAIANASTAVASHKKGDLLAVLDGDNTVVGGLGDDLITAGSGHDVIVMGPGQDTFLGGTEFTDATADWTTHNIDNNTVSVDGAGGITRPIVNAYPQPYNGTRVGQGDDTIDSGVSNATIFGGAGNDLILLGNGNNYVDAGSGNTWVEGGMGNDTIIAGAGYDTLQGGGGNTYIEGGSGQAQIWGGDGNNTIIGGSGNATIQSAAIGKSLDVNGRWDNDTLSSNYVFTGSGNDQVVGSAGHDTLVAGSGNVTIQGGLGFEYIVGGSGKDLLIAGKGQDTLIAGTGDTTLQGSNGPSAVSWLYGGDGTDIVMGGTGENHLFAGDGGTTGKFTTVMGGTDASSKTTITGGLGVDFLQAGAGETVINVGDGGTAGAATTVLAGAGAATINGGAGVDYIQGGSGTSVLFSGNGGDDQGATTVIGMSGVATLSGGAGAAILDDSASGQDLLIAGAGQNTMVGMGADTFIAGTGSDTVQNNGGHVTVNVGAEFGALSAYNFQGGTTSLVVGGGVTAAQIGASVTFDGIGRSFLALQMPTGAASIQGALTGSLADATFDSGALSTPALMTTAFQHDSSYQYGGHTLYLIVGNGDTVAGGSGDTISAWGANETIQGGGNDFIYSAGAGALIRGGTANDSIVASGNEDSVVAGLYGSFVTLSGANSIAVNGLGNGTLTASGMGDTLVGGYGTTQFFVNDSTATVVSNNTTGHDVLVSTVDFTLPTNVQMTALTLTGSADIVGTGNGGYDVITAGAGHDTLVAGTGIDTLIGGTAATTFVVNSIYDKVVENLPTQVDTIDSSVNFVLPTNVNVLALTGSDALTATANSGRDTIVSNTGVDTLFGGTGGDLFVVNNAADVIIQANGTANDTLQTPYGLALPSNVNNLVLTGSANLAAQANDGNDTLVSNSGIDTLIGGAGNDTFVVNNSADVVQDSSSTSSNTIVASVDYTLPVHVSTLTMTGTAALQATGNSTADIIRANAGNDTLTAVSTAAATTLIGGAGNDVFVVNNTADVIQSASTSSSDTIESSADFTAVVNVNTLVLTGTANLKATANDAGDTLVSNSGVDTLVGGAGKDVFVVNNAADILVNVSADDTVIYSIGLTVPGGVSNLVLSGSSDVQVTTNGGDDQIIGNAGNDTITATTGQDTLIAGAGIDTLVAGTGNDLFVVNNVADVVSLSGAHGQDTVQSSVDWTLGSGVNKLVLTGAANLAGHATSGNNEIDGNAGNDTLYAGSGFDTLVAGSAATTLVGGSNQDTFVLHNVGDVITNISTAPGNTVVSYVSYTMQDNIGTLTLEGYDNLVATGNGTSDNIVANSGDDTLIAGSGVAHLYGGDGADLFVVNNVNDVVTDDNYGSKGAADTIQSSVSYTLPSTVDNLVLTGTANLVATGNGQADSIIGNAGNDTLVAGQGDDTLVSGTGVTVLQGGPGNDTFVVNNVDDVVTTNAADSYNVLMTSVSFTMPANISQLVLIGNLDIQGTSNAGDVQMTAGDGNDTLVALGGKDTLIAGNGLATLVGGTGNDTFVVNNSADVVVDALTTTNNAIFSSATFVLPAHVDSLTLTGSADISATGNADANVLTAGYGNDTLIAGSGLATLNGGQGATTFVVDNVLDVVQNASAGQANALQSSVSYVLPTNVNLLTLTGSANLTGTGNAAADTIIGNAGVDTLVSGSGNDLFVLGNGADVVSNAYTTNSDTIQSDFGFVLPVNVNTLVLTGTAAVAGQANGGNDTLVSNSGADTLTGGAGNDTFFVNNSADIVLGASSSSHNIIVASANFALPTNVNTLTLTGTEDLQATGNAAADLITANDGNDTLIAVSTAAVTTLIGGAGNDVFVVNSTADVIQSASTTSSDTIESSVNFTAVANVNTLVLSGSFNLQATANSAGDTLVSNTGIDTLVGGAGADLFVVNNAADVLLNVGAGDTIQSSVNLALATPGATMILAGNAAVSGSVSGANDTLVAGDDDVTLTATGTYEALVAGLGNDLFVVNDASDAVAIEISGSDYDSPEFSYGSSTIQSSVSYTLPDLVDTLVLTGGANLTATGNASYQNVLVANSGNDLLVANAFESTVYGGSGSDSVNAGLGSDVIYAGSGTTSILSGAGQSTVYGVSGSQITDSVGGGNDLLVAGAGAETLTGFGSDTLVAGSGSDLFVASGAANSQSTATYQFNAGFGHVSIVGSQYGETVKFGTGIALSGFGLASMQLEGSGPNPNDLLMVLNYGTGSVSIDDAINPGHLPNIVLADTGPVSLAQLMNAGGTQNTLFQGPWSTTSLLSTGDRQTIASGTQLATAFVFGNSDVINAQNITSVYGFGDADTLVGGGTGMGNSDLFQLTDNQGANVYGSNATITGGSRNGLYLAAVPASIAFTGTGNVLTSAVSIDLPTGFSNLTLDSVGGGLIAHSNAQGGALVANGDHDTLVGSSGADQLLAAAKYDVLVGGSGPTTFSLNDSTDSIVLGAGNAARDTVDATFSYTLTSEANNLYLVGQHLVATANSANDRITVSGSMNTVVGGAGDDTLVGSGNQTTFIAGSGKTTFVDVSSDSTVIENYANTGSVIEGYGAVTLPTNVDIFYALSSGTGASATGNAGNDWINASDNGDDTLVAGSGFDTLSGGSYRFGYGDTFVFNQNFTQDLVTNVQGNGHHVLRFGAGISRASLTFSAIQGPAGTDPSLLITSGSQSVTVQGGLMPGVVQSVKFADGSSYSLGQLLAPTGSATVAGSGGNFIYVGSDNISVTTGSGHDTVMSWGAGDTLTSGAGGAVIYAGGDSNVVTSSAVGDSLMAFGHHDTLISGGNAETLVVNSGDAVVSIAAGQLNDTVQASVDYTVPTNASVMQLTGSGDVFGWGGQTAATIIANSGRDTLAAGAQADTLVGSATGGDVFLINSATDVVVGGAGGATDLVEAAFNYTLPSGVDNLYISGNAVIGAANDDAHVGLSTGGTSVTLVGGAGADTLVGTGWQDSLVSGSGIDYLNGASNETYVINNSSDVLLNLSCTDTIQSSVSYVLTNPVTDFGLELQWQLTGSGDLRAEMADGAQSGVHIIGNSGRDTLIAGSTGGTLESGSGADLLIGGGNGSANSFIVNNTADTVVASSAGVNDVTTSVDLTMPDNVFVMSASASNVTLTASSGNDTLWGNTGSTLVGGSGNDYMGDNFQGHCTYVAGTGTDIMEVRKGDSVVLGAGFGHVEVDGPISGSGSVLVQFGAAASTLTASIITDVSGNAGLQLTSGSSSVSLGGAFSNGTYTFKFAGGSTQSLQQMLAQVQTQNSTFVGASGNLVLNGTASASLHESTGADTILAAGASDTLTGGSGAQWLEAFGTNVSVVGGSGADTLEGFGANETLTGGTAADTFVGGTGASVMFVLNNSSDVIQLQSSPGSDSVSTALNNYTLPTNVNTLVLQGSAALKATANSGSDTLISNAGVDTLVAGTGKDLFILNNAADVVTIGATHGVDTIQASFNDTLAANAAVLVLAPGNTSLMGTGNSLSDTLVANSGNDTLVAGTGVATMNGGTGNDLFIVNNVSDKVVVTATNVSDTIRSSVTYALPANVQYLQLTSTTTALTGTGSATIANMVVGGAAADTLKGGTAVAMLKAGSGAGQVLQATLNQAVMLGGGAADKMSGASTYKDFYGAGLGGDTITSAASQNVIAFNKGDGALVLAPTTGAANVLSLGAGIDTEALTFTKSGNNLVLNDGVSGDSVTFTNWYLASSNQTTKTLQVIEAASASYNASGSDALRNKPIEEFNFTQLVTDFGSAGSPAGWSLSTKEGADTLASSATAAYGGDLAYYFGLNGNLTGLNLSAAQSTLTNASFATGLQTIDGWGGISGGASTMSVVKDNAKVTTEPVTRQDGTADGRQTIQPIVQGGRARADYVSSAALAAAAQPWDFVGPLDVPSARAAFDKLWSTMHRQLDLEPANMRPALGAEAESFGTAVDPVALLAGAGMSHSTTAHDRRITVPGNGLRQI